MHPFVLITPANTTDASFCFVIHLCIGFEYLLCCMFSHVDEGDQGVNATQWLHNEPVLVTVSGDGR